MLITLPDQRVKTTHTTISSFSKSSVYTGPQILPFAILIVVSLYISTQIYCNTPLKFALKNAMHPSPWSSHELSS